MPVAIDQQEGCAAPGKDAFQPRQGQDHRTHAPRPGQDQSDITKGADTGDGDRILATHALTQDERVLSANRDDQP